MKKSFPEISRVIAMLNMRQMTHVKLTALIFLSMAITFFNPITAVSQSPVQTNLVFSTYIGGHEWENIRSVTTDPSGYVYVSGGTNSADYPTTFGPPHQGGTPAACVTNSPNGWCSDIFVTKFTPDGKSIVWSRLIGTPGHDRAYGIKYHEVGGVGYILIHGRMGNGYAMSSKAFQTTYSGFGVNGVDGYGAQNGFVGKLRASDGSIVWISYCGSSSLVRSADIDSSGNVYVITGYDPAKSPWRPDQRYPSAFVNAYRNTPIGNQDLVIFKISADGTQVLWGTYFGGSGLDEVASGIKVHLATGNVYICGQTQSTDLPGTSKVFAQGRSAHGGWDFFVAKFSSDGSTLYWAAYLGGSSDEYYNTRNINVNESTGNVYVSPWTGSSNYPTTSGAYQRTFRGGTGEIAVSEISSDGTTLIASTFLGGNANDNSDGISFNRLGQIVITGNTSSTNFPVTVNAIQSQLNGSQNSFLTVLSSDLSTLVYSTYYGAGRCGGRAIAVDSNDQVIIAGHSDSGSFPTYNAYNSTRNTSATKYFPSYDTDGTVVKFSFSTKDTTPPAAPKGFGIH